MQEDVKIDEGRHLGTRELRGRGDILILVKTSLRNVKMEFA